MKLDDIPFVIHDINKEMPEHTDNTAKIPYSYKQLPKNLMETSNDIMEKYLNSHLHEIEEISHVFSENELPKWMKWYARKYYLNSGILNHDGFFKNPLRPDLSDIRNIGYRPMNVQNVGFLGSLSHKLLGADLIVGTGGSPSTANGQIWLAKLPNTGVIGSFYDRAKYDISTQADNYHVGFYDDVAGSPTNLMADSGSVAVPATGFTNWTTFTEVALTTTQNWTAFIPSTTGSEFLFQSPSGQFGKSSTYIPLPNPISSLTSIPDAFHSAIGHS
jgi:hypothetical protein